MPIPRILTPVPLRTSRQLPSMGKVCPGVPPQIPPPMLKHNRAKAPLDRIFNWWRGNEVRAHPSRKGCHWPPTGMTSSMNSWSGFAPTGSCARKTNWLKNCAKPWRSHVAGLKSMRCCATLCVAAPRRWDEGGKTT